MTAKKALIELHYLPCIAYFSALADCDEIVVEKFEHYQKQSFRNRCYILGPHRIETLIIPVVRPGHNRHISDVRIDYDQKWLNNHWRTIQTAYGNAPFFEYYGPDLQEVLFRKHAFLYDLNREIVTLCLKWLRHKAALVETRHYEKNTGSGIRDVRDAINPKKQDDCNRFYKSIEYRQAFGSKFVPNLSLIDLIFNEGPGSWAVVKASAPA